MITLRTISPPLLAAMLASALAVASGVAAPAGARAAPAPLVGYNDDFNIFELHKVSTREEIIPPVLDLPVPLPGKEGERSEIHAAGAELIELARAGGANVVRYTVPWMRVERKRGVYDFSVEDETYEMVREAGLKPVIVLLTSPCWAHPSIACENPYRSVRPDAEFREHFARFAKATIDRYPGAAAFEVWNESNFKAFWGSKPNPRSYVRLLKATSERVGKGSHPPLLFNGLIPKPRWKNYLKIAFGKQGAGEHADATASHPYARSAGAKSVRNKIRKTKQILRSAKTARAVWVTEVGWSTTPGERDAVSPDQQARRTAKLEKIARKTRVRALIVHRLRDVDHADPWEAGLGALRHNDSPKPLYCGIASRRQAPSPPGC